MYIDENSSKARQREAEHARLNRAEIVRARSLGEITRRDLVRWGLFTAAGTLALKNGLSPFARSAFAAVPTGTPRSPLGSAKKFTQRMPRLRLQTPIPIHRNTYGQAEFSAYSGERPAKKVSYHTDYSAVSGGDSEYWNPVTRRGPCEGRPPGPLFAHQRWDEFFPKVGYVLSVGQVAPGARFHPAMEEQAPNAVWSFGAGAFARGQLPPPLIKARYGEPMLTRIYNALPTSRAQNGGFGRNEIQTHLHNAHNGAESDGAANVHHFPGTFYDYRWSTTLARRDTINQLATNPRASGPDNGTGLIHVAGDFRELQGTLWFHDHRFFFTAENVYKGMAGMMNLYSGPDRGHEELDDGVNLRLPSGTLLPWGNTDFDVNIMLSDAATTGDGQLFFDIFNTDGFLGDIPLVNGAYAPFFEVLPRKYRLRLLVGSMSRFYKLALVDSRNRAVRVKMIANDGNLLVNPIELTALDQQAVAERYDIVVDFSQFRIGEKIRLVNLVEMRDDGRGPKAELSLAEALKKSADDPVLGPILEFRIAGSVPSVDVPGVTHYATKPDRSRVPAVLTEQIPIVAPVRERVVEFGRSGDGDSRDANGNCTPDCPETASFPWTIRINGEPAHSMNANRISLLIPKPGEVEHWTYVNSGSGWDHPIHLHFEEGVTIDRGAMSIPSSEKLVRKDVWRLRSLGRVTFQVQFGEYGGSYVNHCHNTVHEDFAMLARLQILGGELGARQWAITSTPNPTPDGVYFTEPEVLPEADPRVPSGPAQTAQKT